MTKLNFSGAALGAVLVLGAFAAFATPVLAADCPKDLPVIQAGVLTMSINATIPPGQYIDKDGNLQGLNVDLGNEIAKRLCLKPNYQNVAFEVQIPGLQTKRWDMIDTGLYYNEDRAKIMQLMPYSINALSVIVANGNPLKVSKTEDLAGKVVGVEIGGVEEQELRQTDAAQVAKGLKAMDIRVFNTYGDAFLALGASQIDAVFVGDSTGKYYQEQGKFTMAVTGLYPGSPSALATINPVLAEAVADALNSMLADGTYAAMMAKGGETPIQGWKDWTGTFKPYYKPS
jgi:polar amino acid transport system substrate-binding protein